MKRPLALAVFLLAALSPARAQDPATAAKSSSIAGIVVKEPGSEPLKKALVQVVAEGQGDSYTAATDSDGHFRIDNVTPGHYRVFIERSGFAGVNARGVKSDVNVVAIQAGRSVEDLVFHMSPTAIVSGRVTDEDGDPMSGVRVLALRKKSGKSAREGIGTAATNDLGEYRLAGLFPGQYWILALPPPDFRDYERQQKSPPGDNQPDTRYMNTYYPGTYDATQASAVVLKAGDEMPVNLTLVPARTYRVRGVVTGVAADQKAAVELFSKGGDSYRVNADEIGPDGQFEVRGVAPGTYQLKVSSGAEAQSLTAHQDVNVVSADVQGLKLVVAPSFAISGHLHSDSALGDLTQFVVNLRLADVPEDAGFFMSQDFFGPNASVDRQGNFNWKNINPGEFIVQLYGADARRNFYLKSVTIGGRDVTTGFPVSGPLILDLTVSPKGGTIEGLVTEKKQGADVVRPVANATVVAVPEEKYRRLPSRFATGSTDQFGSFTIRGLAPGSYSLYAWQDLEDGLWYDADFLRSQEANAIAVTMEEGSNQKVELQLSPVAAEWQ
ncbi:MAG: carboxypeptidase regulatory-like domain-containing protein [Terriglobales bacterium]